METENRDILNHSRILGDEKANEGLFSDAIEYYKKCVDIEPSAIMYNRIGHMYEKLDESEHIEEQIEYFEKALELSPDYSLTLRNLAFTYFKAERFEESFNCFNKLLKGDPLTDDYVAYACRKIQLGDFKEGWKYYEYRFLKTCGYTEYPEIDKPRWSGESIQDKVLLVQCEQGFGDSIQFFRYLEQVKPMVKRIIFRVQDCLVNLLKINASGVEIVSDIVPIEKIAFDYHIPLMSLLHVLDARIDNIPLTQGYIKADKAEVNKYKQEFFNNDCFKIGITWKGMVLGNKRRNIPLRCFYRLAELKNVKIYSLQKDFAPLDTESLPPGVEIINLGKTFNDFSDTAAAMANLDLFVTSDNSVFNLAGAMGINTLVLLNKFSEWRWFLDKDTTPWYNNVKIIKKHRENDSWELSMQRALDYIMQICKK